MKHTFLFLTLLLLTTKVFSQGVNLKNNTSCDLWVKVQGYNGGLCNDYETGYIYLPPGPAFYDKSCSGGNPLPWTNCPAPSTIAWTYIYFYDADPTVCLTPDQQQLNAGIYSGCSAGGNPATMPIASGCTSCMLSSITGSLTYDGSTDVVSVVFN